MLKKYVPVKLKCVPFNMVDVLMVSGLDLFDNDITDKSWNLGGEE